MANTAQRVGTDEIARLFRTTRQTVHRWTQAGMPHRMDRGTARYVPSECVAWRLDAVRDEERAKQKPKQTEHARDRKDLADAELKELDLRERLGQLLPRAMVEEELETFIAGFSATAGGELARFERHIVDAVTPVAARIVTTEIHEALMRGAQRYAETLEEIPVEKEPAAA